MKTLAQVSLHHGYSIRDVLCCFMVHLYEKVDSGPKDASSKIHETRWTQMVYDQFSKYLPVKPKIYFQRENGISIIDELTSTFYTSEDVRDQAHDAHFLLCHLCKQN